jgi:hypothetical protein
MQGAEAAAAPLGPAPAGSGASSAPFGGPQPAASAPDTGGLGAPGTLDLSTPRRPASGGLDLGVLGAAKGSPGGALGELFSQGAKLAKGPGASGRGAGSGKRGGIDLAWLLVALAAVSALAAAGVVARRVAARRSGLRARAKGAPLQHLS